jgi:hypothetical protein
MNDIINQIVTSGTPNSNTFQLSQTADYLLQNNAASLYTPDNSNKIYTYTSNLLKF